MFLHLSVILSADGCLAHTPLQTPCGQVPPADTPWADILWADTPPRVDPSGRHHLERHQLDRKHPGQTPPWADTPWADILTPRRRPLQRMVHILLECILVSFKAVSGHPDHQQFEHYSSK